MMLQTERLSGLHRKRSDAPADSGNSGAARGDHLEAKKVLRLASQAIPDAGLSLRFERGSSE